MGAPGVVAAAALVVRAVVPRSLPMFNDEAIYLEWARRVPEQPFLSHVDGKPPLHAWWLHVMTALPVDVLVAGRWASALCGAVAAWLAFQLGQRLREGAGPWAGWLVALCPALVLHDRLALAESLVDACLLGALLGSVVLARRLDPRTVIATGACIGLGLLARGQGQVAQLLVPVSVVVMTPRGDRRRWALAVLAGLGAVAVGVGLAAVELRSPLLGVVPDKGSAFLVAGWPDPVQVGRNAVVMLDTLVRYVGPAVVVLAALGMWRLPRREGLVMAAWSFLPLVGLLLLVRNAHERAEVLASPPGEGVLYPRYLLLAVCPLLVAAGVALASLVDRWRVPVAVAALGPAAVASAVIVVAPANAWLVPEDRAQYVAAWTAGHGMAEVTDVLRAQAAEGPLTVVAAGAFGLLPDGLRAELAGERNINIISTPGLEGVPPWLRQRASAERVLVVVRNGPPLEAAPGVEQLAFVARPGGNSGVGAWRIHPEPGP